METDKTDFITALIDKLVDSRERGRYALAYTFAEDGILKAMEAENPALAVNIIAQKSLVYAHLFERKGKWVFNELRKAEIERGQTLVSKYGLLGQPQAVLTLRTGDYHFANGDFQLAADFYSQALGFIDRSNLVDFVQYASALALASIMTQPDPDQIQVLDECLVIAKQITDVPRQHSWVMLSGILLRLAQAYGRPEDPENIGLLKHYLQQADLYAQQLDSVYAWSMRKFQVQEMRKKFRL